MPGCLASKLKGVYGKERTAAVPLFCVELLELCVLFAADATDTAEDFLSLVYVLPPIRSAGASIAHYPVQIKLLWIFKKFRERIWSMDTTTLFQEARHLCRHR